MKEIYRELLGKTYDLEGLLLLALSRKEVSADLSLHIDEKLKEIYEAASRRINTLEPQPKEPVVELTKEEGPEEPDEEPEGDFVIPKETVAAIEDQLSRFYSIDDNEDDEENLPILPGQPSEEPEKRTLRPSFSLNDRFLYTRELFKGDASAFNAAIDKIVTFDTFKEAESYFMAQLGLNPAQRETDKAFLAMIKAFLS